MAQLSLGEALKAFLDKSRLKNGLRAVQIEEVWEQVMGKTIAKYTEKVEVINNKLFVYSSVGPLKNELQYQKPQIIKRVNELMGEQVITEVIIK
ncbi:MAG TPA: DUF721 domain-containing protein [Chitinophagaceae bacterium]